MNKKKPTAAFLLAVLLLAFGMLSIAYRALQGKKFGVYNESILIDIPADELPENTLYITGGRREYRRGEMVLVIPSIQVYTPVGASTEPSALEEMPGLYEFAQLPGEGNVNTSIAGHRDIHDMAFYSLDKVAEGDYLYLLYQGMVYRYRFAGSSVIRPDNWDVIRPQGFPCLTLTTCDPIGTTVNRLVVQGELVDWQAYTEDYSFASGGSL